MSHIHVVVPAAKWLTVLLAHIPDKYEHLVRYYGWYSNRARAARNAQTHPGANATTLHLDETPLERQSKANWARLIQKVYEADPLNCPKCGTTMRVIAVIDEPPVVRHILEHLRLWNPKSEEQRHPTRDPPSATAPGVALPLLHSLQSWPPGATIPLTYHPVPNIA